MAVRGGSIVGDHTVLFALDSEIIELSHRGESRNFFARRRHEGRPVRVQPAPGLYGMDDLFSEVHQDEFNEFLMDAYAIAAYIKNAVKKTPVKLWVKGDLDISDFSDLSIFGDASSCTVFRGKPPPSGISSASTRMPSPRWSWNATAATPPSPC